jgi:3-hydroxybutyryl-CoA dehydrogenase
MRIAVIGAGTMGGGIAQVAAMAGHGVRLFDTDPARAGAARAAMRGSLEKLHGKGRLGGDLPDDVLDRVAHAGSIAAACDAADVVIETVVELIEVNQEVFRQIDDAAPSGALLGTNTSQLSITRIGSVLGDGAGRLVGMHFFNPPVLMRLVELVAGLETSEETIARAEAFARGLGKETVVCRKDSPGFMTSRVSAIVRLECLKMVEEGVGSPADIDKALRLGLNFPMGPLELGDFNGLDTYLHALEALEVAHGERFRPTVTLRNLVAAGRLGRKTGRGVYRYGPDGTKLDDGTEAE